MRYTSARDWNDDPGGPPPVRGILRVCAFGSKDGESGADVALSTVFVPGPGYDGMEDNDIRGFLDGGFQWAYNQVGQTHVRAGRNPAVPMALRYGEPEVFRILHRWAGIDIPRGARVIECELTLHVEFTSELTQRIMLYAVNHDWEPGVGGVHRNNVSVPNPGEVWWNEIGFGGREWSLPGAGYAAEGPDGDTEGRPLAEATLEPGDASVRFGSGALADYVTRRLREEAPLLLLVKLSDACEDEPGSLTGFFSASAGDSLSLEQRPRLTVRWTHPSCRVLHEEPLFLEHGRSVDLPVVRVPEGEPIWITFEEEGASDPPAILVRRDMAGTPEAWREAGSRLMPGSRKIRLRAWAVQDPVPLGDPLEVTFEDTWIVTGPPETQDVHWTLRSPTGVETRRAGTYEGRYRWALSFQPEEVGRWQCRLAHALAEPPYTGPPAVFDVVVADPAPALNLLRSLAERIAAAREGNRDADVRLLRRQFIHVQRGLLRSLTPRELRSDTGRRFREELRNVRSALWGEEVPERPPLESMRLYEEHEGDLLDDPIPYTRHVAAPAAPRAHGVVRRYRRRAGRLLRRMAGRWPSASDGGGKER